MNCTRRTRPVVNLPNWSPVQDCGRSAFAAMEGKPICGSRRIELARRLSPDRSIGQWRGSPCRDRVLPGPLLSPSTMALRIIAAQPKV